MLAVSFLLAVTPATASTPTKNQLRLMDVGLTQFMHYSVDPYAGIQHNCVHGSTDCIPAAEFNPTDLSTDQWVEAAASMGAGEICLTAHHEGGFCLWDTAYSNYSVMHSPYGKDIVKDFVASCKKHSVRVVFPSPSSPLSFSSHLCPALKLTTLDRHQIRPCYYMGPNANGYLMSQNYTAEAFVEAQLGMLKELLTKYGNDYVGRLWWDHWPGGCNAGLEPCPNGSFPDAWPKFIKLVRDLSPSTIICPGPDCDGHQGETGIGKYPAWFPCTPDDGGLTCEAHAANASLSGFHPYETCTSMHNGWFVNDNGTGTQDDSWWDAQKIWDHYMFSVGIGWVNTLNAPPGTNGRINETLTKQMKIFGDALRALQKPLVPPATDVVLKCGDGENNAVEIDLGSDPIEFNSVIMREDLTRGQSISSYQVDYYTAQAGWLTFEQCGNKCIPGGGEPLSPVIPPVARGQCGAVGDLNDVNLVIGYPPSVKEAGIVDDPTACGKLCEADSKCNFWTLHEKKCYVREDNIYHYKKQDGYSSGICNRTLPSSSAALGVHGKSVGAQLIDLLPNTTATKVRFRCLASLIDDQEARLASFSVNYGIRPPSVPKH